MISVQSTDRLSSTAAPPKVHFTIPEAVPQLATLTTLMLPLRSCLRTKRALDDHLLRMPHPMLV
jgi:hypothetical protein